MLYANNPATLLVQDADGSYFILNHPGNILVENAIQAEDSIQDQENVVQDSQQLIYYTDEVPDEDGVHFVTDDVEQFSDDVLTGTQLKLEPYEVQMSDEDSMVIDRLVFVQCQFEIC